MPKTKRSLHDIFTVSKEAINAKENGYSVIIPHICSNNNTFNSAFAEEVSYWYPDVKTNYYLLGKGFLIKNPGYVQFIDVDREKEYNRRLIVASVIGQNSINNVKNKRTINYAYLVKGMVEIKKYTLRNFNSENKVAILMSRQAFKNGGGNWNFINDLVRDVWHDLDVKFLA